jgi:hypothetical protein
MQKQSWLSQLANHVPTMRHGLRYKEETSLCDFVDEHSMDDGIPQVDDGVMKQECLYDGEQMAITRQTDVDLAGQVETRQSTSGFILHLDGALIHWRGCTERIIMSSTAAAECVAMARGNTACKFVKDVLSFYDNGHRRNYYL